MLITPRIRTDPSCPHGGKLVVTFPEGSSCETFGVPLNPSRDTLDTWEMYVQFPVPRASILNQASSIPDCTMFGRTVVDGHICPASSATSRSPSAILSEYFRQPVHFVVKGPKRRDCDPTLSFPDLKASAVFQDGFPLLVISEESLEHVRTAINNLAREGAVGGMKATWENEKVEIERLVLVCSRI